MKNKKIKKKKFREKNPIHLRYIMVKRKKRNRMNILRKKHSYYSFKQKEKIKYIIQEI